VLAGSVRAEALGPHPSGLYPDFITTIYTNELVGACEPEHLDGRPSRRLRRAGATGLPIAGTLFGAGSTLSTGAEKCASFRNRKVHHAPVEN
jgi:hypothetical protein